MTGNAITGILPHRPPMLLLDEILDRGPDRICCRKAFHADEPFCRGYTPLVPVVPAVFLCECALQAGAILLFDEVHRPGEFPVATRLNNVFWYFPISPGDSVLVEVTITDRLPGTYFLAGKVTRDEVTVATLDFSVALVSRI